jgi:hypothetical protein
VQAQPILTFTARPLTRSLRVVVLDEDDRVGGRQRRETASIAAAQPAATMRRRMREGRGSEVMRRH